MDLTAMKNIILHNSMLQLKIHYFPILFLIIFLSINGIICSGNINSIFAQSEDSKGEQKSGNNKDSITTIKVKINKNNIDISNYDRIKIVGYLNGEGQTKYLDLKKELEKKVKNPTNENSLISLDMKFNKSNEISSVTVGDQYYVCAYLLDDYSKNHLQQGATTTTDDPIPLFDCMEGDIGKSTNADTITLFPTMKKYGESKAFYAANSIAKDNTTTTTTTTNDDSKQQVKIIINVPMSDAKDIDDMNVVAMIKGEDQIKTIDVQNELKKGYKNDKILVPFIFDRETELGPIQPGDLFFGCVTSDEFPGKKSKCEKRMLKDLDETSKLCARKDSSCK